MCETFLNVHVLYINPCTCRDPTKDTINLRIRDVDPNAIAHFKLIYDEFLQRRQGYYKHRVNVWPGQVGFTPGSCTVCAQRMSPEAPHLKSPCIAQHLLNITNSELHRVQIIRNSMNFSNGTLQ